MPKQGMVAGFMAAMQLPFRKIGMRDTQRKKNICMPAWRKPSSGKMRIALTTCTLAHVLLIATAGHAADYPWPVARVVDGDTVAVDASADLPPELAGLKVRLRDVDTPEKVGRAKCASERRAGQVATAYVRSAIASATRVVVRDPAWGKWGGRVVADALVDGRSHEEKHPDGMTCHPVHLSFIYHLIVTDNISMLECLQVNMLTFAYIPGMEQGMAGIIKPPNHNVRET